MTEFDPIAVIGGGAWGTALANAAAAAGRGVTLWLRDPAVAAAIDRERENVRYLPGIGLHPAVRATADPKGFHGAQAALVVVPAQTMRQALGALAPSLGAVPLVLCAKGIERDTGLFMTDVAVQVRPDGPVGILSGPSFATDVARSLPTAVTLAFRDGDLAMRLATALSGPTFRIYHGTDVRGVEIGGAAKNVLAIAAGIVEGRALGDSAKAALVARGFAEMMRIAAAAGGRPETLMGLSGLGDLVLTCGSEQSRNFSLGVRMGRGEPAGDKLAEGALTAAGLVDLALRHGIDMPVSQAVAAVLAGRLSVDEAVTALLSRPLRSEV